ncbi:DsbA family oxidoreductase [Telmatospirillum sp. J64-1]|uniref:DsbA family oxidoreductase n=1 Tax=Telmatospirillum sp. J64-1 TaxID=2502183 RepID=UPI00115EBD5C|nr:DsbA family oxidoreductase [Telmatospirillum sp. J64-1]
MRLDIIFDTVCPWCYIGKRRFERALAERPALRPDIRWRPFLLNPDLPPQGVDRQAYMERKFGGAPRLQRIQEAIEAAGRAAGISFRLDLVRRVPNSLHSHRLIALAAQIGREAEMVETLFSAYFTQGLDIGDHEILADLGESIGLDRRTVLILLASDIGVQPVRNENARAQRLGVNGVPCFIVEETYAIAGAQEYDILLRLLDLGRMDGALLGQPDVASLTSVPIKA